MKNVTYFFILFLLTLTTPLFADPKIRNYHPIHD